MSVNTNAVGFDGNLPGDKFTPVLKLVIKEVAERAGFRNALDLSKRANLPYESVRRLWQGTATMVSLGTLERLCQILEVRPAQLFDYEAEPFLPNKPERVAKDKPSKKANQ
jgi:DNA-binding Xre family transcriptional regulator